MMSCAGKGLNQVTAGAIAKHGQCARRAAQRNMHLPEGAIGLLGVAHITLAHARKVTHAACIHTR